MDEARIFVKKSIGVVILGGHGDGEVVAASILEREKKDGSLHLVGFLNDALPKESQIANVPVLGRLEEWRSLPQDTMFIAALHKVRQMKFRVVRIQELEIPHNRWVNVIDPAARLHSGSLLGVGTYLGPNSVVQPGAKIGSHVSIRAGANVGHDAIIDDYCYLGPNSTLCGRSSMGIASHLGPNSSVADNVRLGEFSVVGIGSAVTKNVLAEKVVFGVPAKPILGS